ncbi:MAG TPA: glycoside hydrolase family 88 protein [Mucilaginibacter sp.]
MKKIFLGLLIITACKSAMAQNIPLSQRMAATAMTLWKDSLPSGKWTYDQGVILKGIEGVWQQTGDGDYFKYIQHSMDKFITADGNIKTYKSEDYNLDNLLCGRNLLTLYTVLGTEKYYKAINLLRNQLKAQPRVPEGGFWHKKRYPNQMWLDGLYMAEPFYAEYASTFKEDADFDDIANQFILAEARTRDPKTGLLYHAWDQSKKEKWADPQTGLSKNFWGRADGWYAMALVDVLDYFPANHPKRAELLAILNQLATAIKKYQDANSGVWFEVLDKAGAKGNYLEASVSCMFVYALEKGVRMGYLPASYQTTAKKGYNGIIKQFIETDAAGQTNLKGTVSVGGLGGDPYRDGSYQYYLSEKVVTNDPKGVGAFILASVEMERADNLSAAKGKVALLDSYFNDEHKKDERTGKTISFHYKWDEMDNNGFSLFGHVFNNYGFSTKTLYEGPNAENLKNAAVYIVVDPDIPKENPDTKYIEAPHIKAITEWVKAGGTLVVLNNDTGNAEFVHLNKLMAQFGITYNEDSRNHVTGKDFDMGAISIPAGNAIFKTADRIYIKEISTFKVHAPATSALTDKNDVIIAIAKYGKGTVFAVGDPWFYNEYLDGRKLPLKYENFKAANDLVAWLAKQLPSDKK